jgi:hypothetical protein
MNCRGRQIERPSHGVRAGPKSFTTVMDNGMNPLDLALIASTDWRGEFVKSGPKRYEWPTTAS